MAKPWSAEEDRILRAFIGPAGEQVDYDELQRLLTGRTRSAIQTMVHNARIEAEFGFSLRVKDHYKIQGPPASERYRVAAERDPTLKAPHALTCYRAGRHIRPCLLPNPGDSST